MFDVGASGSPPMFVVGVRRLAVGANSQHRNRTPNRTV